MRRLYTATPPCPHGNVLSVVAYAGEGAKAERLTVCRDCYRTRGPHGGRWTLQDDAPAYGSRLMPWPDHAAREACFEAPAFDDDPDPPFLLPLIDPAWLPFNRDAAVGERVAFLVSFGRPRWIEARVVWVGDDANGQRGIVALTEQGLTLRGNECTYVGLAGGLPFWAVSFFGDEERLNEVLANHRRLYPLAALAAVVTA